MCLGSLQLDAFGFLLSSHPSTFNNRIQHDMNERMKIAGSRRTINARTRHLGEGNIIMPFFAAGDLGEGFIALGMNRSARIWFGLNGKNKAFHQRREEEKVVHDHQCSRAMFWKIGMVPFVEMKKRGRYMKTEEKVVKKTLLKAESTFIGLNLFGNSTLNLWSPPLGFSRRHQSSLSAIDFLRCTDWTCHWRFSVK